TELIPDVGQARIDSGEFGRAEAVIQEALERSVASQDNGLEARARVALLMVHWLTSPEAWSERALRELPDIIERLEAAGDHRYLAKAWALIGYVHGTACRYAGAELAVGRALDHARLAGDRREEARNLSAYAQ